MQPEAEEQIIICSSLLPSIKKQYPDHKIYFFTDSKYFDLINSNENIDRIMHYSKSIADPLSLEGRGPNKKYFDLVFSPHLGIRNNYYRNGSDNIPYDIHEHS